MGLLRAKRFQWPIHNQAYRKHAVLLSRRLTPAMGGRGGSVCCALVNLQNAGSSLTKQVFFFFFQVLNCLTMGLPRVLNSTQNVHHAESLQSCLTLCDPIDGSPPRCPVPGILQARTLEWVAISFSNAWKWKVKVKSLNHVGLLATPWTAAHQAPPSMGFSRQKYWSGVPLPSPVINHYFLWKNMW